jgi:hypothetical protein
MAGPTKEFEVHPYVQFMFDKYSPYRKWIESEGVPIIGGEFVQDVRTHKLGYWERKGCKGAICTFSDQMVADGYIARSIPANRQNRSASSTKKSSPSPRGAAPLRCGMTERRSAHSNGNAAAPSQFLLNVWHQHFNASGSEPMRYFALTSQPIAFELYRDAEFIYNTNYQFKDRFDPATRVFFQGGKVFH